MTCLARAARFGGLRRIPHSLSWLLFGVAIAGHTIRRLGSRELKGMNERQYAGGPGGGESSELRGTVKWFNPEKGFGFVSPADGSPDVFLHISALKQAGLQDAPEGSTIVCEVGPGRKGVQVLRVITLDTTTAVDRPPRRPMNRDR